MTSGGVSESTTRASDHSLPRQSVTAMIIVLGGMTIIAGTLMPWMTLLAGLQSFRGIIGLYGKLIAAGGVVAVGLGLTVALKDSPILRLTAVAVGAAVVFSCIALLHNLTSVVGHLRGDPMMVASQGKGLYICLIGGALLCGSCATFRSRRD
jgi:hypothetical protein